MLPSPVLFATLRAVVVGSAERRQSRWARQYFVRKAESRSGTTHRRPAILFVKTCHLTSVRTPHRRTIQTLNLLMSTVNVINFEIHYCDTAANEFYYNVNLRNMPSKGNDKT